MYLISNIKNFTQALKNLQKEDVLLHLNFSFIKFIKFNQFDTIYHNIILIFHYLLKNIFEKYGLKIYDVHKINTHGGSLSFWLSTIVKQKNFKKYKLI